MSDKKLYYIPDREGTTSDATIAHYGVKGMRWGVRRKLGTVGRTAGSLVPSPKKFRKQAPTTAKQLAKGAANPKSYAEAGKAMAGLGKNKNFGKDKPNAIGLVGPSKKASDKVIEKGTKGKKGGNFGGVIPTSKKQAKENWKVNKKNDADQLRKLGLNKFADRVEKTPVGGYEVAAVRKVAKKAKAKYMEADAYAVKNPEKAAMAIAATAAVAGVAANMVMFKKFH